MGLGAHWQHIGTPEGLSNFVLFGDRVSLSVFRQILSFLRCCRVWTLTWPDSELLHYQVLGAAAPNASRKHSHIHWRVLAVCVGEMLRAHICHKQDLIYLGPDFQGPFGWSAGLSSLGGSRSEPCARFLCSYLERSIPV